MLNFDFYNPTRVLFGQGRIADLGKHVPADARVLILYGGGSVKKNGTLDEVLLALEGRQLFEFGGIEPNPTYETLSLAVAAAKREKIDFLLAVGGGSVIDGTKYIAAAACHDGDGLDILHRKVRIRDALPIGAVLTLAATGSEMNSGAVVTHRATHTKLAFMNERLFPRFAVLDPTKTFTLDERQIGNGIVDAYVHIMEQYLTIPVQARVQDRFAEGLLQTLLEIGPQALANPKDYSLRANLMWVATMALNGLIGAGVPQDWSTHMIGHELTALYDIDHARTLAIVLPAMMSVRREAKRDKLLQYAERVWQLHDGDEDTRIQRAIERTRVFFDSLNVPTRLSAYQLGSEAIDKVISQLEAHGMTALGERKEVTPAVARQVLEAAL